MNNDPSLREFRTEIDIAIVEYAIAYQAQQAAVGHPLTSKQAIQACLNEYQGLYANRLQDLLDKVIK